MSPAEPQRTSERETTRLEAFSDGIFAIAITLLVLEIKVPHFEGTAAASALTGALLLQWPAYLSLVTSFFTILIMWVHHHLVFRMVQRADTNLLFVNGLLLLFVSVVPFPTAVLAEYMGTPAAASACTLYAGFFVGISVCFQLLVWSAFRPAVLAPAASRETIKRLSRSYWAGPPLYLAATLVAPFFPMASVGICTALWIFWAAMTREC
jgi:uncharacterized membrane protein